MSSRADGSGTSTGPRALRPEVGPGGAGGVSTERRAAVAARSLALRRALERTIRPSPGLTAAATALSSAYRSGAAPADPGGYVHDRASAEAYAAARMPATFAAIARAMTEAALALPGFAPTSLLDVGGGTGAATWGASAIWPGVADSTVIDREPAMIELGRRIATTVPPVDGDAVGRASWRVGDAASASFPASDVVAAAYLIGELGGAEDRARVVARLWAATKGALIVVEPGGRPGFRRILDARSLLIELGATIAAPCPGNIGCPVREPAWCHFLARLDRSPLQQRAKRAVQSWEDEPFSYLVATRVPSSPRPRIVLGRPRQRPGQVELRICRGGRVDTRIISRRDGQAWRTARDLAWGDRLPDGFDPPPDSGPDPLDDNGGSGPTPSEG